MHHTEKKKTGDNFYKLLGEGRNKSSKKVKQTIDSSNSLYLSTTSSFYYSDKKSDSYLTLIQMLKSDLLQIQDMINSNTQDIKMFKLLSKAPGLSKKLSEIEEQKSISHLLDKITEDSQKYEKISKIYNCNDYKQLVQKIFLELSFNELLLKKIYDFFVLMKLSLHKDDTYQESLSKIISIKSFIEKTISKINEKNKIRNIHNNNDNSILKIESLQELLTLNNDKNTTDIIKHIIKLINKYFKNENESIISKTNNENNKDEYKINVEQLGNKSEILKFEQIINELINIIYKLKTSYIEEKGKNEKLMNEISEKDKLIEAMNNNTNSDINNLKTELENEKKKILEQMEELNKKYEDKEKEYDLLKEENNRLIQEISQCKENEQNSSEKNLKFEDDLKVKDEKILDLEKINSELNNKINELNKKINELNNKITELEKKKNNNIDINKVMKDSDIIKMVNNYDVQLKKLGNDLMNKNKDELRDLENKLKNLESKYEMIVLERESLKKNIIYLKGKKYDPDSYEEVLKEQFETMRNAFTQKIDDLNEELNDVKRDSRVRIYNLELELKENVRLKNNFLKQIISLQSQLDSLNQ
jgi:DNA repair exonuclease SbcCD ATPase subunit